MNFQDITSKVLKGERISREEASYLAAYPDLDALCDAADMIRKKYKGDDVDSCSIVNARSGMCGEDCKWCAQSVRYATGCDTYNIIDENLMMEAARTNENEGIRRLSLVTSGKRVRKSEIDSFCDLYRRLKAETDLYLCASMGLIGLPEMKKLAAAGVKRYHCNMETSSEFFRTLCSTHTPEDKKATIKAAREAGLDVCSGGIIGMGETMEQRIDFAFELAELDVDSVPINILNPIKGTPLQNVAPISEEEIARTVAVFRFVLPDKSIRFAGGRLRLSKKMMLRIMRGGMNGVLMGDMLTTVSNTVAEDREMFREAGFKF